MDIQINSPTSAAELAGAATQNDGKPIMRLTYIKDAYNIQTTLAMSHLEDTSHRARYKYMCKLSGLHEAKGMP